MGRKGEDHKSNPKISDEKQSERFKDFARQVGASEISDAFDRIMETMAPIKEPSGTIAQFYISRDNEADVATCRGSMKDKYKISITASTIDGQNIKWFEGIVQSIDEDATRGAGKRYKVTIRA
jgi:hypothetical protein